MPTNAILPIRFRTEAARQFHRTFTNTINVATENRNSLTPVNNVLYQYVAEADQTLFTGLDVNNRTLAFVPGRVQVFVNGSRLLDDQFLTNPGTQIELNEECEAGDEITIVGYSVFTYPNPTDYYYTFLGRTIAWDDDEEAPTPVNTRVDEASTKNNIISVKKVGYNDAALLVRRIDWTEGTIYNQYVDDEDYSSRNFYVMNTSFRIYKCIYSPGTPSEVMPEQTNPGPFFLEDGYCWQLLYEVPAADRTRFLDQTYIPVRFYATSSTFDHNAVVDNIEVTNGGTGYTSAPTVVIFGDGVGAEAEATVIGNSVAYITMTDQGYGYTFAIIDLQGGGGSGATATALLGSSDLPININQDVASYAIATAGAIDVVEVVERGTLYLSGSTTIEVDGDGVGARFEPIIDMTTGQITGIRVLDRGLGYTFANLIVNSVTGSGAVLKATVSPEFGHGGDIPKELFATAVGITSNIDDMAEDFFISNDFRQIGIIKNIKDFYKTSIFSGNTGTACYVIEVPNDEISEYNADDVILSDTGGEYLVIAVKENQVYLLPVIDSILESSVLRNETTGQSNLTINELTIPEISTKAGDIIYIGNTTPINREQGQVEQLKLAFRF